MEAELLNQAKRAEMEREIAYVRLIAAASAADGIRSEQAPGGADKRPVAALPARVLRALRLVS